MCLSRELESSVALAAGRCSWAPGRGSVACAHGELSLGVMSEAAASQGAALYPSLCLHRGYRGVKNPN